MYSFKINRIASKIGAVHYEINFSNGANLLHWSLTSLLYDLRNIYGIDLTAFIFNPEQKN